MPITVYKSSAGSGKTFTLVLEYLRLVLKDPAYFRHVLAMTFTNKAANEMKTRVLNALVALATADPQQQTLQKILLEEGGLNADEIQKGAETTFHSILHHYSDFNIGTIDSFSHRIIQTFSRDLGLPPLFEVEMETPILLRELVDELIAKVGTDEYLTRLLVGFLTDTLDDDRHWRIDRPLIELAKMLLSEESFQELGKMQTFDEADFDEIINSIGQTIRNFKNSLNADAKAILEILKSHGLNQDDFYLKSRGFFPILEKLARPKWDDDVLNLKTFQNSFDSKKPFVSPKSESENGIPGLPPAQSEQVMRLFAQMQATVSRELEPYRLCRLLRQNIYATALMPFVVNTLQELIERKQQVPIFEFNKRIAALLQASSVPYIYERLGDRFRSFLLDEFQDTSVLQWQNLLPLIENALAGGNRNLIVGDGKQSIYRFRGGEFQQFTELPKIYGLNDNQRFAEIERVLQKHYHEVKLKKNYRSLKEIVRFNNEFFSFLSTKLIQYNELYKDCQQQALDDKPGGYVRIEFFRQEKGDATNSVRDVIKEKALEIIQQATVQGYNPGDIAVLVRSNNDGDEIANFLNQHEIDVVSADSLLLQNSPSVKLIINSLKFIFDPDDAINCFELWMNLSEFSNKLSLPAFELNFDLSLINNLHEIQSKIRHIIDILTIDQSATLYDLTEELIRRLGLSNQADPYVQFLLQQIYTYQSGLNAGKKGFFEFWEQTRDKASVVIPENSNAVKVMTIHKAKGLEFPVVIFAFASMPNLSSTGKFHWIDVGDLHIGKLKKGLVKNRKDLEITRYVSLYRQEADKTELDTINLIYVAFTRAISQLHVLTIDGNRGKVPEYLKGFLEQKGEWQDQKDDYTFGIQPQLLQTLSNDLDDKKSIPDSLVSFQWKDKLRVARMKSLVTQNIQQNAALDRGNLIHLIMSYIHYAEEVEIVLQRFFQMGVISQNEQLVLMIQLKRLTEDENLNELFRQPAKIKTEAEIMDENGKLYRMDRVVELPDSLVVVDFKTGSPNESHQKQLQQYAGILQTMQPGKIRAILIYFDAEMGYHWEEC